MPDATAESRLNPMQKPRIGIADVQRASELVITVIVENERPFAVNDAGEIGEFSSCPR